MRQNRFEKLSEKELEQALRFIELMSEVLIETFK